jgi:hypothetical protein
MISGVVVSVVALWIESLPTSVLSTLTGMAIIPRPSSSAHRCGRLRLTYMVTDHDHR